MSAKMIPSRRCPPARFLVAPVALLALFCLPGCAAERETTLSRSSRARDVGARRAERLRQERELELWRATRDQTASELAATRMESVRNSSLLRATRAQLLDELRRLQHVEQDLEAAKVRARQIEQELLPLRALEATLRDQQRLIDEAAEKVAKLEADAVAASKQATEQEAATAPRLAALQQRLAELQAAGVALADVEAKIATATKVLAPPAPPPEPAKK